MGVQQLEIVVDSEGCPQERRTSAGYVRYHVRHIFDRRDTLKSYSSSLFTELATACLQLCVADYCLFTNDLLYLTPVFSNVLLRYSSSPLRRSGNVRIQGEQYDPWVY